MKSINTLNLQFICLILFITTIYSFNMVKSSINRQRKVSVNMQQNRVPVVPYYLSPSKGDYQWMDIYNALGRTRTLFVGRFLDDEACNQLIASLVWLQGQGNDPITLYFNVPGALGKPAWAVYDTMKRMSCPLRTINMGLTVGMGCLLVSAGTSGERFATPNSRFLMSKAGLDDGLQGQAAGLALGVKEVMRDNEILLGEMARLTGQPLEKLTQEMKRDFYLTAPEAAAYGVVDKVLMPEEPVKMMRMRGDDHDVVGYGHFSETRKVASGPHDKVMKPMPVANDEEAFDEYTMREMMKRKDGRPNPKDLKNGGGATRFSNSRCRPPSPPKKKKTSDLPSGNEDEFDKNPFKNVF